MKVLSICGSPRRGNSETILLEMQKMFREKGIENEIVLLREKKIERCHGCVEFCNHNPGCRLQDDMKGIIDQMVKADAFVFICPNYFQMPPGLFKDFIDRSNIIFNCNLDPNIKNKKSVVICVGADKPHETDVCTNNIANLYCRYVSTVVATKSFQTKSELKGNLNDVFENSLNPDIKKDIRNLVDLLIG